MHTNCPCGPCYHKLKVLLFTLFCSHFKAVSLMHQKYNRISCFWETQPLGCVRISCVFHHSKPRNINGLFLPPSSNATLQKEVQEGTLHPAHSQEPLKAQESTLRPIHPPLIINISLEEEEEEEEEENYASYLLTKTPADIEEEKAIKEMCYKSGEYYRIQTHQENQSAKIMSSALDNELLKPMETGRDLQEGDGVTVPTKFNIIERQGEVTASLDGNTRTDLGAFENGGGDCYVPQRSIFVGGKQSETLTGEKELITSRRSDVKGMNHYFLCFVILENIFCFLSTSHTEPVKKRHFKGVKKKKWISEEPKNSFSMGIRRTMHASNPKGKANCQQNDQCKDAENTSYVSSQRTTGRSISLNSPEPGRSTNMTYNNVGVTKESKLNPSTGELPITQDSVPLSAPSPYPTHSGYPAFSC
uniref:Zinc-finger CCCH domain-containing protein n=1 Tax=Chelydra serpentina TaxID=8475 RepID=A0A8C3S961_CHESE